MFDRLKMINHPFFVAPCTFTTNNLGQTVFYLPAQHIRKRDNDENHAYDIF